MKIGIAMLNCYGGCTFTVKLLRLIREATKALMNAKRRAILMMLGIIIGIASLTVIVSIGEATKLEVIKIMSDFGFGADALYIRAGGGRFFHRRVGGNPRNLTLEDMRALSHFPYVKELVPQQFKPGVVAIFRQKKLETLLIGVLSNWATARNWDVPLGRFINNRDIKEVRKVCVLGQTVRKKLFGKNNPLAKWIRLGKSFYKVIGVLKSRGIRRVGHDLDNRILVPMTVSSKIILHHSSLSGFRVNLVSKKYLTKAMTDFRFLLRERHHIRSNEPDDFTIITSTEILNIITRQTRSLTTMLAWISGISLFVSGIVIMNIMLVSVAERRGEIGIRRSLGAQKTDILWQFLAESVIVSIWGGMVGMAIGYGVFKVLSTFLAFSSILSWKTFVLATLFSSLTGLTSGLLPAVQASKLSPLEAMR